MVGETRSRPTKNSGPAIFYFQPTAYKWIDDAELSAWEKAMATNVGIAPGKDGSTKKYRRGKSFFKCGGAGWDGCDSG